MMIPIHTIEYEMTSEMATEIHRALVRWELRRGWRRDIPKFLGALAFSVLIGWLSLQGWMLPVVGGGLLCLVALFVMGAMFRRWSISSGASAMALLALQTTDRRVQIEFAEERVRLETEFFRGEGAWTELDEVVIFPTFWYLHLSNDGQVVIPARLLKHELESFIRAKAQQVMAPIRQGGG